MFIRHILIGAQWGKMAGLCGLVERELTTEDAEDTELDQIPHPVA